MKSLCLVFVRMEGTPTARGETRERSPSDRTNSWSSVSSSGGNSDGPERHRRRPAVQTEGQTTQEFSSSGNPAISSHRGPGTVPVEQPEQAGFSAVVVLVEGLVPHQVMRSL